MAECASGKRPSAGDRALQQIAGRQRIEPPQSLEALRVESGRFGRRRLRRLDLRHRRGRQRVDVQPLAQPRPGSRDQLQHVRLGTGLADERDGLAFARILQAGVEADRARARLTNRDIRPEHHEIRTEVVPDPLERVGRVRIGVGERQLDLHARHVLSRNRTKLLACRQLRCQHFGKRRGQPGRIRPPGYVLEAQHRDRAADRPVRLGGWLS
jgi:hypothetical protein